MTYDFDTLPDRRDSESIKWNKYADDVIPMWVADMDFLSPPPVVQALKTRAAHGVYGYPEITDNTRHTIIDWLWSRYSWAVEPDELLFLPGVVNGFNLAAHALCQQIEGVLVQTPTYRPFFDVASNVGLDQHNVPLDQHPDGRYLVTRPHFEDAIQDNTRIFMLCNPQNPTGRVFNKQELTIMAEVCLENEIYICADEIHSDIVYPGHAHIPMATLSPSVAQRTITLLSPSKTFNVAGLKAAFAVIQNQKIMQKMKQARQGLLGRISIFGQVALQASYAQGGNWLEKLISYLDGNRTLVCDFVNQRLAGFSMVKPEATYLAWINCNQSHIDQPQEYLLEEAKVAVNPGTWFGEDGEGYVRLNFGCPRDHLMKGLQRIEKALSTRV